MEYARFRLPQWPVFRCPSLAVFGCPLTVEKIVPVALIFLLTDGDQVVGEDSD
jgi:hypothetical protein